MEAGDKGIDVIAVEPEIAQAVEDGFALVVFDSLQDVGVGSDHGVRSGIDVGMGAFGLGFLQFGAVFHAPVGEGNDVVGIFCRLPYGLQKAGIVIAPEDAGLCIGCLRGVDRILRAGGGDIGDPDSVGLQIDRGLCLVQGPSGTDIGDLCILQGLEGVHKGFLPVIEGVIVGESHDVHTQVLEIFYVVGVPAEGPGLGGQGLPAAAVDKFVVDPHQVHVPHDPDIAGIDSVGDILRTDLLQVLHGDVIVGEADVAGKAQCKVDAVCLCSGLRRSLFL